MYLLFYLNNSFSFACKARHASERSKAIPSGMNTGVSPSANHWIMLIASDEWYYSVIPATLMAIHLAPSLPVISQPHVFWKRAGGEGRNGDRRVPCIRASSLPVRVKVRMRTCSGLCRASAITPVAVHSNCRYRHVFSPARRLRRKINHLADKRDEVTNEGRLMG